MIALVYRFIHWIPTRDMRTYFEATMIGVGDGIRKKRLYVIFRLGTPCTHR